MCEKCPIFITRVFCNMYQNLQNPKLTDLLYKQKKESYTLLCSGIEKCIYHSYIALPDLQL